MTSFRLEFEHQGQLQEVSFDSDSITLGRDRSSDFVLDHPTVSRQHALIVNEGGGDFRLVVLSRGGLTAIDGQPVEASEVKLYDGMMITLGKYSVRFRSEYAPKKAAGGSTAGAGAGGAAAAMTSAGGAASASAPGPAGSPAGPAGSPAGSAGSPAGPAGSSEPPGSQKPEQKDDGGAGIQSWDEIAASSEADEESSDQEGASGVAAFRQAREEDEEEETNPVIVVGGLLGAVFLLMVAVFGGASSGEDESQAAGPQEEVEAVPVEVSVNCHDETSCRSAAESHYERGIDLLKRPKLESNLFDGYVELLTAKAALEEGGIEEIPEHMADLVEERDEAREELDGEFQTLEWRYDDAEREGNIWRMVETIEQVKDTFPDPTAQEYQWAEEKERQLRRQGEYPDGPRPIR